MDFILEQGNKMMYVEMSVIIDPNNSYSLDRLSLKPLEWWAGVNTFTKRTKYELTITFIKRGIFTYIPEYDVNNSCMFDLYKEKRHLKEQFTSLRLYQMAYNETIPNDNIKYMAIETEVKLALYY